MRYENCLVELDEILNHLDTKDLEKIPKDIIKAINEKKDMQYIWKYDKTRELNQQNIDRRTIAMLSYLNMKYLLNAEQINILEQLHRLNEMDNEKTKLEKYGVDIIFPNNIVNNKKDETGLTEVKVEKWYQKIWRFIKNIINK